MTEDRDKLAREVLESAIRDLGEDRMADNFRDGQHPIIITSQAALNAMRAFADRQPVTQETLAAYESGGEVDDRFWLLVHEPGNVPVRKGPWGRGQTTSVLREFIAANPSAYLHLLTLDYDGSPQVDHGPEVLQILDGRSMSVGRKHNARTLAAHTAEIASSPSPAGGE